MTKDMANERPSPKSLQRQNLLLMKLQMQQSLAPRIPYQRIPLIPNLQLKNPRLAKATVLKIRKLHLTLKIVQTPLSLKIQTRPSLRKLLHLRKTIAPKSNSILFLCSPCAEPKLDLLHLYWWIVSFSRTTLALVRSAGQRFLPARP